jgi:diguanylate cyclase (GGDEF)-like protein
MNEKVSDPGRAAAETSGNGLIGRRVVRSLLRALAGVALALAGWWPLAGAAGALELKVDTMVATPWPVLTLLADPTGALTLDEVLRRRSDFRAPEGPTENLGVRRDVVWLAVPVLVHRDAPSRWVISIDYPSLDEVDVYLVDGRSVLTHERLGDSIAFAQRTLPVRSHAAALVLQPGGEYELVLRVKTSGTMVVPIAIMRPDQLLRQEAGVLAVQWTIAGVALCLTLFSLFCFVAQRDLLFLCYGINTCGTTLFFLSYYGVAAQGLWPNSVWLAGNAAPAAILFAIFGASMFVSRAMGLATTHRRLAQTVEAVGWIAIGACALFASGLIGYRLAYTLGTFLGPIPMVLAFPLALKRALAGERTATFLVAGWGILLFGIVFMVALLRGLASVDAWTMHSFQIGSVGEMLCWMFVLVDHVERIRKKAEQTQRDHEHMRRLATTDSLTGLLNRRGLGAALDRALKQADRHRFTAVFMVDLDSFKAVNDQLGHPAGDTLLIQVAQRLGKCVRGSDIAARLGGDEFVVAALDIQAPQNARDLGQKMLDALAAQFDVEGRSVRIGATIGFALAPDDGKDSATLLERADQAMYKGKDAGKRRVERWLELESSTPAAA